LTEGGTTGMAMSMYGLNSCAGKAACTDMGLASLTKV
jgi:hypothetical protein